MPFFILHVVHSQLVKVIGMARRQRKIYLIEERSGIVSVNGDIVRVKIVERVQTLPDLALRIRSAIIAGEHCRVFRSR
jgi:hypothetical protein